MGGAVLLVATTACWRSNGPASPGVESSGGNEPEASVRRVPVKQVDLRDPILLERALRSEPSLALSTNGPVVVIDFDRGQIDTLCDAQALAAQETWQRLLIDPSRPSPACTQNVRGLSCMQAGTLPLLVINFSIDPEVHPVRAMIGRPGSRHNLTVPQIKAALTNPTCP